MSDHQPHPAWWQASDLKWYPPEMQAQRVTEGPTIVGRPGEGPDQVAANWARGAAGERTTERALMALPPTYHIFHGLKTARSGSDIDHVVIGPSGIWVVDTKDWSGVAEVRDGDLKCGRYSRANHVDSVQRQATLVRERLGFDAAPMLCFVGELRPRPAMMIGRVRLVTVDSIAAHIRAGTITMGEDDLRTAIDRARSWKERPQQFAAKPAPPVATAPTRRGARSSARPPVVAPPDLTPPNLRRTSGPSTLKRLGLALCLLAAVGTVIGALDSRRHAADDRDADVTDSAAVGTSLTGTPSGPAPTPGFLRVSIDCPVPGGGYELDSRVPASAPGSVRVSATIAGVPRYLGEIPRFTHAPAITGVGPGATTGFDVQSVDDAGQGGASYHLDIVTPTVPC
jgi:hypothetical protein